MNPDYVLILSAGMGTRMGELGKALPKPLWPVFDKTLFHLQIEYAIRFNPKKIFVNIHHQYQSIQNALPDIYRGLVQLVYEPALLGVGGAVHNIKKLIKSGSLLIINSDQFYLLSEKDESTFLKCGLDTPFVLLAVNVGDSNEYNKLICDQHNFLMKIEKSSDCPITYSGVSLINLDEIGSVDGFSNFFDSVANFRDKKVKVFNPMNNEAYWDFGTLDRYLVSIGQILEGWNSTAVQTMRNFLLDSNSISPSWIGSVNYHAEGTAQINFSGKAVEKRDQCVTLDSSMNDSLRSGFIYSKNQEAPLPDSL